MMGQHCRSVSGCLFFWRRMMGDEWKTCIGIWYIRLWSHLLNDGGITLGGTWKIQPGRIRLFVAGIPLDVASGATWMGANFPATRITCLTLHLGSYTEVYQMKDVGGVNERSLQQKYVYIHQVSQPNFSQAIFFAPKFFPSHFFRTQISPPRSSSEARAIEGFKVEIAKLRAQISAGTQWLPFSCKVKRVAAVMIW